MSGAPPSGLAAVRSYYRSILPFYEKEVASRRDLAFWSGISLSFRPATTLEIGCGLGAVTGTLAQRAPVVAFDVSIRMLARARTRLRRLPALLFAADARALSLSRRFDLVVAAGDPFSHWTRLSDRRAALRAIARHLTANGRFVLDGLLRAGTASIAVPERPIGLRGRYRVREIWTPSARRGVWTARFVYRRADDSGPPEAAAVFQARSWDPAELPAFFASCGLEVEALWGGFDRSRVTRESRRVVVVARRRRPV